MSTFNFSGTNCQPLLLNRLSILLLVIAVGCSQPESPQATGVSPEPSKPIAATSPKPPTSVKALSAPASFPQSDPFPEVIDTAMDAATITQSAVSPDDWKLVVSKWQQAIALLKTVPPSHPKKALAQQKIGEYQRNLAYAKVPVEGKNVGHIIFSGSTSIVRLTSLAQIARNSLNFGNSTDTFGGNFNKICQR